MENSLKGLEVKIQEVCQKVQPKNKDGKQERKHKKIYV